MSQNCNFQDGGLQSQILREINFVSVKSQKLLFLTVSAFLNFDFSEFLHCVRAEIYKKSMFKASNIVKMAVFDTLNFAKVDFT